MGVSNIYLDHNATTPVDERVLETMLPYFSLHFGNAASNSHSYGWVAKEAVETARQQVATLINCLPQELIFTSGATESVNLAIKSVAEVYATKGKQIVTVATEHAAVLDSCLNLEQKGYQLTVLPVDREGHIDLQQLENAITQETILVCIMSANNETGVLHPMEEISKIVHSKNSLLLCDATQAVGKIIVDVQQQGIDLLALSAHKLYGPKGVGALYVRRKDPRVSLVAQIHGGGHERGLRSGTLNVPGIVGLGKAAEIAAAEMWDNAARISRLRTILEQHIQDLGNVYINGDIRNRLPNTTNLAIAGIKAEQLISKMPRLAMATGSACSSALPQPSHVLKAIGLSDEMAYASLRLSLGKNTSQEDIENTIRLFQTIVPEMRQE
jgi:cysteine desulfurase